MKQRISLWLTALWVVVALSACNTGSPALPQAQGGYANLQRATVTLPGFEKPSEGLRRVILDQLGS